MSTPRITSILAARQKACPLVKSCVKDGFTLFQLEGLPQVVNQQVHHLGRLTSIGLEDDQE